MVDHEVGGHCHGAVQLNALSKRFGAFRILQQWVPSVNTVRLESWPAAHAGGHPTIWRHRHRHARRTAGAVNTELGDPLRASVVQGRRDQVRDVIARGVACGDLQSDVNAVRLSAALNMRSRYCAANHSMRTPTAS